MGFEDGEAERANFSKRQSMNIQGDVVKADVISDGSLEEEPVEQHVTVDDDQEVLEGRARNTSDLKTSINILKSYMGSGLLGLPYAFKEGGVLGSLIIMPILGVISVHCMFILVKTKQTLVSEGHKHLITYGDIANHCYNRIGEYLVNLMLMFTQFGFCCVYVVYVSENLENFVPKLEFWELVILWMPVFILLSFIRTMKVLAVVSVLAILAIMSSVIILLVASVEQIVDIMQDSTLDFTVDWFVEWKTVMVMLGMAVYAYEGIGLVLPCETAIKNPSHFTPVLLISLILATLNYIIVGIIPYLAFGAETCDIVTSNLCDYANENDSHVWGVLTNVVTIALIFAIAGTYPLQLFVVTDIIEAWMFKPGRLSRKCKVWKENGVRTALVLSSGVVAIVVPDFSTLLSLIGSIGSSSLQFIFPPLLYLKVRWNKTNIILKSILILYALMGLAVGILGTLQTIMQIINDPQSCSCKLTV